MKSYEVEFLLDYLQDMYKELIEVKQVSFIPEEKKLRVNVIINGEQGFLFMIKPSIALNAMLEDIHMRIMKELIRYVQDGLYV